MTHDQAKNSRNILIVMSPFEHVRETKHFVEIEAGNCNNYCVLRAIA